MLAHDPQKYHELAETKGVCGATFSNPALADGCLFRVDVGKQVFYALDEGEKKGVLDRVAAEKLKGKVSIQRFKGLGEMNPLQLRETVMAAETRRLVRLTLEPGDGADDVIDMLLAKGRAADRRAWLEQKGNQAEVIG